MIPAGAYASCLDTRMDQVDNGSTESNRAGTGATGSNDQARARVRDARVARLATVGEDGTPHLVPVTFALDGDRIVTAIDHKPKTTTKLRRLRNIRANPKVCVLVDHYDDDWTHLWWVRADGLATIVEREEERAPALASLVAKYPQYADHVPEGPVIVIQVTQYANWSYSGAL
jgi:PPOX class probable F420-dependent enzyme